jgi:spermidine/putrescine-binding protein
MKRRRTKILGGASIAAFAVAATLALAPAAHAEASGLSVSTWRQAVTPQDGDALGSDW